LTAGDWDLWGTAHFLSGTNTNIVTVQASFNTVSATMGTDLAALTIFRYGASGLVIGTDNDVSFVVGPTRVSISATTTYYFVAVAAFSVGALGAYGKVIARRAR
jgi:hypothetical protein